MRTLLMLSICLVAPAAVQAQVTCGATLPAGSHTMTADILDCATDPALRLQTGAILDMRAYRLSCDSSAFTGIMLEGSGAEVRNGKVSNCGTGVALTDAGGHTAANLALVDNVVGIAASSDKNSLTAIVAHHNGSAQISLLGNGNKLSRSHAGQGGDGVVIDGDKNKVSDTSAIETNRGFAVTGGSGNSLKGCLATDSTDGFSIAGSGAKLVAVVATRNSDDGIALSGSGHSVAKSTVVGNSYGLSAGYDADCIGCKLSSNRVWGNSSWGVYLRGTDNRLSKSLVGQNFNGVDVSSGNAALECAKVSGTVVLDSSDTGIYLHGENATIAGNFVIGSGDNDLHDEDSACTSTTWSDNLYVTRFAGCEQ